MNITKAITSLKHTCTAILIGTLLAPAALGQTRMRDYVGAGPGVMKTGQHNAITDVNGVKVGHVTLIEGNDTRTGVTAILPHPGNIFRQKVPAAVFVGNGFGKLAGTTQVQELGNIETPIILTNTLNVAEGIVGAVEWTLAQKGNERVGSVNAVVGETNDGRLNNIRARRVTKQDVINAIENAKGGPVEEGCVGAGTGTVAFGFKGGIGTASRVLPASMGGYTVGVIVQSNYGGVLEIDGVPVGQLVEQYSYRNNILQDVDGSCMIVVATDAPVDARNLERIAKRAFMGLAKTGSIASNGSGDYIIAFSTCPENLIDESKDVYKPTLLHNDDMSGLFMATIEATEEALWNSLFAATDMEGNGSSVKAIDKKAVAQYIKKSRLALGLPVKQSAHIDIEQLAREHSIPSMQLSVYKKGEQYKTTLCGNDLTRANKSDDVYQAASLSKVLFSYIVMRLVDEGKIDLDIPVCRYTDINRFVDKEMAAKITARMILSHTSGLYNWTMLPFKKKWAKSDIKFHYPADSCFAYSGEAFSFLQRAVENVTGKSLNQLAKKYVFDPFDMPLSSYEWRKKYDTHALDGFTRDGKNKGTDRDFPSNCAYTLRTTSTEYMNFLVHALMNGEGLSRNAYKEWTSPRSHAVRFAHTPRPCDQNMYWGLGMAIVDGKLWHYGDNGTFKCLFVADPASGVAFDYFTNSGNGHDIANEVCEKLFGESFAIEEWIGNRDDD